MRRLLGVAAALAVVVSLMGNGGCGSPEEQAKLHTNIQKLERDSRELEESSNKLEKERGCTPTYCPHEP